MKMIVGRIWNAKITAYCPPSAPSELFITFDQTATSPSGPNTNRDPSTENASRRWIRSPSHENAVMPTSVLTTINAKSTCRPRPHPTTRGLIARRFVDNAYARARMPTSPINGWSRVNMSTSTSPSDSSELTEPAAATNICSPVSCTHPITSGASAGGVSPMTTACVASATAALNRDSSL